MPGTPAFGRQRQELQSLEQWEGFPDARPEAALANSEGGRGPSIVRTPALSLAEAEEGREVTPVS